MSLARVGNSRNRNLSKLSLLFAAFFVLAVLPFQAQALERVWAKKAGGNRAAIKAFFAQDSLTLTLFPQYYVEALEEAIVPVKLSNGSVLRIEIPWDDPAALDDLPRVTLYPSELVDFAGRRSPSEDVSPIESSIAEHIANRSGATICGNRSASALAMLQTPSGNEETEIGFIYKPGDSEFVTRSVAASAGCPLLASRKDCQNHKYCEVRVGIPPFTVTVSGRCYPGPWPLGKICRCWLLAPDPKGPAVAFEH